jgi:hypothetical protein
VGLPDPLPANGFTQGANPRYSRAVRSKRTMSVPLSRVRISLHRRFDSRALMARDALDPEVIGWWRIVDTSQWGRKTLDRLGTAMLSITGGADQLRMHF